MKGIDVSTLQGNIDWKKVREADVEFAMIKATQGRGEGVATRHLKRFTDGKFKKNIVGASDAGIACGVYHYMTAQTIAEAREEALYFCSIIAPYREYISLWAAVDVESSMYLGNLGRYDLANVVREFMDTVKANGYKPMLYTNPNYITYRFPPGAFDNDEIWLAHYNVKKPMTVPNTEIWQYGVGKVDGIKGDCDLNEGYFNEVVCAIAKLAALGVINTPEFWYEHYNDKPYIDTLLIRSADVIKKAGKPCATLDEALAKLVKRGLINTPEYWQKNADEPQYLTELIKKIGGSV